MKFKRFLCGLTAVAVAAGMLTTTLYIERKQNAYAAANAGEEITVTDGQTYTYKVNTFVDSNGKPTVTLCSCVYSDYSNNTVVIPPTITDDEGNEYTVTEIGNGSSSVISSYTPYSITFTIPDTVTKINDYAFSGYSSLSEINIPDSVKSIGKYSFKGSGLTSVNIPSSVKTIGMFAFESCYNLTSVTISEGVESIGEFAFYQCPITAINIPASLSTIGGGAFMCNTAIESVTIPNTVKSMGTSIFSYCQNLKKVTIEDGVKTIAGNMFSYCSSLETISIPNSVLAICERAFTSCSNLKSVVIPDSVTSIGSNAFSGCNSLSSVNIPNSVISIGSRAFTFCSLDSVEIPDSVISIGDNAFSYEYYDSEYTSHLTNIIYKGTQEQWKKLGLKLQAYDENYEPIWYDNPDDYTGEIWYISANAFLKNVTCVGTGNTDTPTLLDAPTDLSYTPLNTRDVQISWNPVKGASKYIVKYCKQDDGDNWYIRYVPSDSIADNGKVTFDLKGLVRNQNYRFTVAAIDADGTIGEFYKIVNGDEAGNTWTEDFLLSATHDDTYNPPELDSNPVDDNETFENLVYYTPTVANYTVEHYKQDTKTRTVEGYILDHTDNLTGEVGKQVTAQTNTYDGMEVNTEKSILSGKIKADGSLALQVFYDYVSNTPSTPSTPTPPPYNPPPYNPPSNPSDPDNSDPDSSNPESSEPESSNPESSEPESSEPESSEPETSEPEISVPDNPNPPTGIAAFLVPIVLASGAAVIATIKRKK